MIVICWFVSGPNFGVQGYSLFQYITWQPWCMQVWLSRQFRLDEASTPPLSASWSTASMLSLRL